MGYPLVGGSVVGCSAAFSARIAFVIGIVVGFMSVAEIDNAFKSHQNNNNVVLLRAKGLDEKLSELDIVAILLNMANYRGYSDFYEEEDKKKRGKLEAAIHAIET